MLEVNLRIPATKLAKTAMSLTDWAGQENYADNIYQLSAVDPSGKNLAIEKTGERTWTVFNNRRPFNLTYTVVSQKDTFMGNNVRNQFHPNLFRKYVFLWGATFLLFPDDKDVSGEPVDIKVDSNEYGPVYSNFEGKAKSFDKLSEFFLAAGDYRPFQKIIGGRKVQFLLEGKWKFSDAQFIDAVSKIIDAQVKYLGFYPASSEALLVTLNEGTPSSNGGTVVENVLSVYPNPQSETIDFETLRLISHEHFHFWNGTYIHDSEEKREGYYKWFSEGFTEYYAGLTLYREGLIDSRAFTSWLNKLLLEYQTNPVASTATADIMAGNYWKSNDYKRLPYVKGTLIALLLDLKIRQATGNKQNIDDLMKLFVKDAESRRNYDDKSIIANIDSLLGGNNGQFYNTYILGAQPLPVSDVLKESGINASGQQRDVFELGFTTENGKLERNTRITKVIPDSGAAQAGLKDGDEIGTLNVSFGRPQTEATIGVKRGADIVPIRYYPKRSREIVQIDNEAVFFSPAR